MIPALSALKGYFTQRPQRKNAEGAEKSLYPAQCNQIRDNFHRMFRNKMKKIALLSILLLSVIGLSAQGEADKNSSYPSGLILTIRTDKPRYAVGEEVRVTLTWENPTKKKQKLATSPMTGHVLVFNKDTNQEVVYNGMWACGTGSTQVIAARDKFQVDNVLNAFIYPDRDLTKPGRYVVRLNSGSCCRDEPGPSAEFEVVRLDEEALREEREKAANGDKLAVQVLAAHGDASAVPVLGQLVKSSEEQTRRMAYQALLILNTEESMAILGERANAQIPVHERMSLVRSLVEMKPEPKASLIPFMLTLLKDPFVGGTSTTQKPGEKPRTFKLYIFRRNASLILKRFNIDAQVVEEEEVIEPVANKKQ